MSSENELLAERFFHAWSRKNVDELLGFFADDAVYHNMPIGPVQGKEAIRQTINGFLPAGGSVEFRILNIACAGDVVFAERIDIFEHDGRRVELPVVGALEIHSGKIKAWRDYFDLGTWTRQNQE